MTLAQTLSRDSLTDYATLQVALITYMAHIGSFVPAESAVIGLTDKILTRLQTRETVSSVRLRRDMLVLRLTVIAVGNNAVSPYVRY